MKRVIDILASLAGLLFTSPFLLVVIMLVWLQDRHSPFYKAPRVGRNGNIFRIVKMRSMIIGADKNGIDSTSSDDARITKIGHFIRRYKVDELTQLWNVMKGDMSLVGPRPQVEKDVSIYTDVEKELLSVRPGITDFSSIVFADEGKILESQKNPDIAYNQLIRPWKSRLGLFYIKHISIITDISLILITILIIISRQRALDSVQCLLRKLGADDYLVHIAGRTERLVPYPPPGSDEIVTQR